MSERSDVTNNGDRGGLHPTCRAVCAMDAKVPVVVRCRGPYPSSMMAQGVLAELPWAMSCAVSSSNRDTPMSKTTVWSCARGALSRSQCPVSTVKPRDTPRWVTGIPAAAGTETADVTPGSTVTGMLCLVHASYSSPPRPKT